jgi:hypothetical protein
MLQAKVTDILGQSNGQPGNPTPASWRLVR